MEVKVLRFYPFPLKLRRAQLLGYADIQLGTFLEIKGIKLLQKDNGGIFILPPSVQDKDGTYKEVVKFLDRQLKEQIRKTLKEYYRDHYGD